MITSVGNNYKADKINLNYLKNNSYVSKPKNVSFGRALTLVERVDFQNAASKMLKKLGISHNIMVIHSPSFPPEFAAEIKKFVDKGIGSSCDEGFKKFLKFSKDLFGIDGLQLGPETRLTKGNHSPYSHGAFSFAEHLISPIKLFKEKLISESTLNSLSLNANKTDEGILNVDYDKFFDGFSSVIDEAYGNFKNLAKDHIFKKEFGDYKNLPQVKPWLEKDAIYHNALMIEHKNDKNIFNWPDIDKKLNLYLEDKSLHRLEDAEKRLLELKTKYSDSIEKFEFAQFLAHRQKIDARKIAEDMGQKILGDVKIGNGMNDTWAFPKAFLVDLDKNTGSTLGCAKDHDWGVFALNHKSDEAKKFLELKMDHTFLYNHGARLDAVFGYVEPFLTRRQYTPGQKDVKLLSEQVFQGDSLIKPIVKSIHKNLIDLKLMPAENLGSESQISRTRNILNENGIPELHNYNPAISQIESAGYGYGYGGYGYGYGGYGGYGGNDAYAKGIKTALREPVSIDLVNKFDKKWFAASSHDTNTLINITGGDRSVQKEILANDFLGSNAYDTELGWKKQFSFMDAFGIKQRYNTPGDQSNSWFTRLPENYEELYYKHLAEDYSSRRKGYNLAEILLDAADKKGISKKTHQLYDKRLLDTLNKFKGILSEKGPYTTEEAEKLAEKATTEIAVNEIKPPIVELKDKVSKKAILIAAGSIGAAMASVPIMSVMFNGPKIASENLEVPVEQNTPKNIFSVFDI